MGWEKDLDWYREQIRGKFEAKVEGRLGPGKLEVNTMRALDRLIYWTEEGIEYEADQRHAEIMVSEFGLGVDSKRVSTLGVAMK
ncbi:MAG: hypothetical protein ACKPKO_15740, partial [Candidatus Fonsibacter sp.]